LPLKRQARFEVREGGVMYFRTSSLSSGEFHDGRHRFEHWYRDNTVYFITARCRERKPAFASEEAKAVFWDRFSHWMSHFGFVPWVTTVVDNHYHTLGYLRVGANLGKMMQRAHGSIAKLVNDLLPERLTPFWYDSGKQGYFDGCIRNEKQARLSFRYVCIQSERHRLSKDWRTYPHTRVNVDIDRAVKRALELRAFAPDLPYPRYGERPNRDRHPD
jgi:REP element-mobilizing transposase RayT